MWGKRASSSVSSLNVPRETTSWLLAPGAIMKNRWAMARVFTSNLGRFLAHTMPSDERSLRATPSGV